VSSNANHGSSESFSSDLQDEKSIPMGVGEFAGENGLDPLANAGEKKKLNTGYLLLVVVVLIAGAGLWFMRAVSHVSASTSGGDAELTISKFLQSLQGSKPEKQASGTVVRTDANVVSVLSETYTNKQVPLSDVQRNPFILDGEGDDMPVQDAGPGEDPKPKAMAAMKAKFEKAGNTFELKSVIMSSSPLANVSGKIVRVGDELVAGDDELPFRVSEITADSITLVGEEPALNLSVPVVIKLKRDR
jgi:hypothetical protein